MGIATVGASTALAKYSQLFTSSGTFTLPSGYSATNPLFVDVVIVGGGGGGGGGQGNSQGAGGGGSGCGFYYQQIPVYANTTVTIGTGGTGGTGGPTSSTAGTNGGSSLFGDLQAPGGGFGQQGAGSNVFGASLWTGTFYNSAVYLSTTDKAVGGTTTGSAGPGGSSGSKGEGATAANVAGIFGGISSSIAINNSGGTYESLPFYAQSMSFSQGVVDGGGGYSSTQSGAIFGNPGEGLHLSASNPRIPSSISSASYAFIGKKWWVPGGGGGGFSGASGWGGSAGTKTTPGKSGANTSTFTGQSATANTGGGGGGGGSSTGGTTGGDGGAGGSGYVLVSYYA